MRTILDIRLASLGLLVFGSSAAGCFAIVNLDQFHSLPPVISDDEAGPDSSEPEAGPASTADFNLKMSFLAMTPHLTQMFEYRVVDNTNLIQSRGFVNPLGAPDVVINVPLAVPRTSPPFRLDFYADVNGSGNYDGVGSVVSNDHAWRIFPLDSSNTSGRVTQSGDLITVTFMHDFSFTDIDTLPTDPNLNHNPAKDTTLGASIQIQNAAGLMGKLIQVRIVDSGANHTVGLYRVPKITQAGFTLTIPGCVEPMNPYSVLVYVDANSNGTYDNPATGAGDLGWTQSVTAGVTGLTATQDLELVATGNVDVGRP